jgi:hypothetical protein
MMKNLEKRYFPAFFQLFVKNRYPEKQWFSDFSKYWCKYEQFSKFFFKNILVGINRAKKISFQIWRGTPRWNTYFSGKSLIAPEPEVGKFQNWTEMKVNYPTNKKNTHKDFSDNFHKIENFVQVDHLKKVWNPPHFLVFPLQENRR